MLVAFSVAALGTGESVGELVAEAVRVVRDSGLPNRTDAMFTTLEGEWDEVMAVVKRAVDAVAARAPRVSVVLKADVRPGVADALDRAHLIPERGVLLPGAREVLFALAGRPRIVQTTVTGNIAPVAHAKLAAFGLDAALDLTVGAYGTEAVVRPALVAASRRRAEEKYGPFAEVLVIGDTVHDVAAALACEVTAIGVATGRTTGDQLRAAGAHAVLDSLADVTAVVTLLAPAPA